MVNHFSLTAPLDTPHGLLASSPRGRKEMECEITGQRLSGAKNEPVNGKISIFHRMKNAASKKSASTNRILYFVVVFSFLLLLLSMLVQVPSFKGNIFSAQFRSRNHFLFLPFHFLLFFGPSFPSLLSFCSIFSPITTTLVPLLYPKHATY